MQTAVLIKKPSEQLQELIASVPNAFGKLQDTVNQVLEMGRKEGFSDREIGNFIRVELTQAGYSRMTLSRYLPASAKHMEKSRLQSGNKMLPNKPFQFVGKINRYTRNRHCIIISDKIDIKRFEGKQLKITLEL